MMAKRWRSVLKALKKTMKNTASVITPTAIMITLKRRLSTGPVESSKPLSMSPTLTPYSSSSQARDFHRDAQPGRGGAVVDALERRDIGVVTPVGHGHML